MIGTSNSPCGRIVWRTIGMPRTLSNRYVPVALEGTLSESDTSKSLHEPPMLLRIAAGTGNDNVLNRPVGSPVSSTCPTNALFTPLLGQSTYIWTAPK